jgi:hypothetical protein
MNYLERLNKLCEKNNETNYNVKIILDKKTGNDEIYNIITNGIKIGSMVKRFTSFAPKNSKIASKYRYVYDYNKDIEGLKTLYGTQDTTSFSGMFSKTRGLLSKFSNADLIEIIRENEP